MRSEKELKQRREAVRRFFKKHPWVKVYHHILERCKKHPRYIKREVSITIEEIKTLWFRDKAANMKCPTIHRKNNDKGYFLENCCFIEKSENSRLGMIGRKVSEKQRQAGIKNLLIRYTRTQSY